MKTVRLLLGLLTVFSLSIVQSVSPGWVSPVPANAATAGSGVCGQVVDNATDVVVSIDGTDCVVEFRRVGDTDWTVPTGVTSVSYLVVAGGGGGGSTYSGYGEGAGGGGAGGLLASGAQSVTPGAESTITVGGGGNAGESSSDGGTDVNPSNGQDSSAFGVTATGGGRGGFSHQVWFDGREGSFRGALGGSGGGGHGPFAGEPGFSNTGGLGTDGQGYKGGDAARVEQGGGGGGAGEEGKSSAQGGAGGDGLSNSITGTSVEYSVGGSAGVGANSGSTPTTPGSGGGGARNGGHDGQAGRDGIVIVRYSLTPGAPTSPLATAGDASVSLSWAAPAHTGGITPSYYVEYLETSSVAGAADSDWIRHSPGVTLQTGPYPVNDLTNGVSYTFRISATNASVTPSRSYVEVTATPRATQSMTWSPGPTWINTDITTSVNLGPAATVLGGVSVTYAVTSRTGTASCTISDSSTPAISSISGSGTCVITATSAEGVYTQATQTVTLTVFGGSGSGNTCDQNVSNLTVATNEVGADCVIVVTAHSGSSGSWVVPDNVESVRYLIVGGGGAGGSRGGGGGGAGGVLQSEAHSVTPGETIATSIGDGGSGTGSQPGADGEDSVFDSLTAFGGGGGGAAAGSDNTLRNGRLGGSGGGSATGFDGADANSSSPGAGTAGQGNSGGRGHYTADPPYAFPGGGGGGFARTGETPPIAENRGGNGGDGLVSSITGTATCFAAGGGGGVSKGYPADPSLTPGSGGSCGALPSSAGAGSATEEIGGSATANSGSGGGGSGSIVSQGNNYAGGSGGSGVVIIRYTRPTQASFSAAASSSSVAFNSTVTLSSSGGSGTGAVTFAVSSGDCTLSGSTLTANGGTGSCEVTATKAADASYAVATDTVTVSLTKIAQASLTIEVDSSSSANLDYGDTATLSSSGGSGTGAVTFSVDSGDCSVAGTTVTVTGATTACVISAVKASDTNYLQASSANTVTISVSTAAQTITFGGLSGKTYGAADFSVSATSSSGLPVSFTSNDTDVCTVSGSTVSIVAVGTCSITANQAGNSLYSSASGVTQTFSVSAKAITVAVTVADKVYDAGTTATVSSGVLSGVVSGDTVSFVAVNAAAAFGTAAVASGKSVTVTLDGDELSGADAGNYSLTVSGSPTASITKKPITVNVTPAGKTYDGTQSVSSFTTSLSGVESGDTVSVDSGEVSVEFDAPGAGTQTATATVTSSVLTGADAGNYSASVGTVSSAVIAKASQATLSFTSASSVVFDQTLTLVATGGSGSGSITYGASGDCTLSTGVITPTGAGSCSVTATRATDSNYLASNTASQTITISQANQSINFTSTVPVSAVSGTTYTPTATASSGLPVSFLITTGDGTVCSLNSGVVTFSQSGTCVITASQAGDTDYNAASSVTQTIVAGKINQTITFPAIAGKDFDDPAFAAGATVSSGRTVTFATSTGSVCAVNSSTGVVSIKTVGDCTVTASSAGDASYATASNVSRTFTISPVLAGKPSVTSVSFGDSSVTVAFVAPGFVGGDAIDGYQVVATSTGGSVTKPDCSTTSPCTITGLTNGDAYTLTVAAINAAGVGPASAASPSITPARVADAVSGLATTPGDEELAVSWTALTDDQVTAAGGTFTRYDVYLRVNGGSWGSPVNVAGQSSNSYTFTGLTNGTAYDVKVVAITNANSSELSSNTATALGVPATVPDAPTGLVVSSLSNTTALASWTAPADDGGDSISAYSVNLSCTFVNSTDTFCTLSGLTAGARVTVTVGATNLMGTGSTVSYAITMPGGSSGSSGSSGSGSATTSAAEVSRGAAPVVVPRRVILPLQPVSPPRAFSAPVVILPERGFDPDAGSKARIGGAPATVSKRPLGNQGLSVQAGAFELGVMLSTPSSTGGVSSENPSNSPELRVPTGESTKVAGAGLLPGSSLQVWLPGRTGVDARELARIPVSDDGTFDSELSFTAERSEVPIPIGRQVLQVTGYDEDGNQTVVDMTINIAQGSPQPELNRAVGALPDLSKGQSLATSAGVPETVTIEVQSEQRSVAVLSGQWEFSVEVPEGSGDVGEAESGGSVTLVQSTVALVSGDGFQPDTRVDIWLFSDPTLLGSVVVSADGSFTGEVYLDARFAVAGEHTLQLQGVAEDGFIKAANLGVEVQEPVELTTQSAAGLLWWVTGAFMLTLMVTVILVVARRRRSV